MMFQSIFRIEQDVAIEKAVRQSMAPPINPRRLPRFKIVNGRKFQLHATRGWKCIGRATA